MGLSLSQVLIALALAIGCGHANAGQLRAVDEYKFRNLAAGCWTAVTYGAEPTIGWMNMCIGAGKLTVRTRGGRGPLEGSFTIEADRMVIDAPIAGDQPAVTLTCDAVVRPYSGLALRHCQVGSTSYPDVEFSYDSNDVSSVLLGCWERVDDDIFPEDICFDPVNGFETSVSLPDAREGFGSPGKYTLDSNRLGLQTEHPYEGWLWRDESSNFSCELELTDVRHMALDNCDAGVKATRFSRETGP